MRPTENESWLVHAGDEVIGKKTMSGKEHLTPWERLVYILWVVDYCMCNAGDLSQAELMHDGYRTEAVEISGHLSLPLSLRLFETAEHQIEANYFEQFEAVCDEVRSIGEHTKS